VRRVIAQPDPRGARDRRLHLRILAANRDAELRARLEDAQARDLQAEVLAIAGLDQARERRVVERPPPRAVRGRLHREGVVPPPPPPPRPPGAGGPARPGPAPPPRGPRHPPPPRPPPRHGSTPDAPPPARPRGDRGRGPRGSRSQLSGRARGHALQPPCLGPP